jgi:hypothetical protein
MDVYIDRLRLVAAGMAEPDAERLGILVANALAANAGAVTSAGESESVDVNVQAGRGMAADAISQRIVAEIVRQLNRTT